VTVNLELSDLTLDMQKPNKIDFTENPWNATVSTRSRLLINTELATGAGAAKFAINSLFTDGLELEPLIHQKVPWLNLTELELFTGKGWLGIEMTPQFDKHKIIPPALNMDLKANQSDITIGSKYSVPVYNEMMSVVNEKQDLQSLERKADQLGDAVANKLT